MSEQAEDLGNVPHATRVEAMAGLGLSAADIACALDLDPEVLKNTYGRQLRTGRIKANSRVAESLYRKATGEGREAVIAAIFWLKSRANWKETIVNEHTGTDGNPIEQVTEIRRIIVSPNRAVPASSSGSPPEVGGHDDTRIRKVAGAACSGRDGHV